MRLELPWPPSVNHYFRYWQGRTLISREGRVFRSRVCAILVATGVKPLPGGLAVVIEAYPPDWRRRDIDNLQKPLLDALEKGGAFFDDCQIKDLHTRMLLPVKGGKVLVNIRKISQ